MKISERPRYEENPFHGKSMGTLGLRKFPLHPTGPMLNKETGEIVSGNVYLHKKFGYVDTFDAVKVFKENAGLLSTLSGPGIKVFFYVVDQLRKNEEQVYISPQSALKFTGYKSNKDVYKGIAELIELNVIARSTDSLMYWVNPNVLFSGNKVSLIKED